MAHQRNKKNDKNKKKQKNDDKKTSKHEAKKEKIEEKEEEKEKEEEVDYAATADEFFNQIESEENVENDDDYEGGNDDDDDDDDSKSDDDDGGDDKMKNKISKHKKSSRKEISGKIEKSSKAATTKTAKKSKGKEKEDQTQKDKMQIDKDDDDDDDDENDASDSDSQSSEEQEEQAAGDPKDDDDDDDDDDDEEEIVQQPDITPTSAMGEPCTFDLRNLLATNSHQINPSALYSTSNNKKELSKQSSGEEKKQDEDEKVTIPSPLGNTIHVNEEYLLEKATDGATQLISALWQLPVTRANDGNPLVVLPSFEEMMVPRALPCPAPKAETRWEKFAKGRGIALNKNKRSQKVWDEAKGEWLYRHGYNKAATSNDEMGGGAEWPIMEVKGNQDPFEDPWERERGAKKARVDKNVKNRLKNQERAGALPKGTTNSVMKGKLQAREAGMIGNKMDRDSVTAVRVPGIPIDLGSAKDQRNKKDNKQSAIEAVKARSGEVGGSKPMLRGKESTLAALQATQRSTASMGKFDKMIEGEPARKKALRALASSALTKKRKHEGNFNDKKVIASEAEKSLKLIKQLTDGGGAARERLRQKGKLATGETAFDYDYNDGLGPSTFRKKKGRAGVGKMRKMTKKRIK